MPLRSNALTACVMLMAAGIAQAGGPPAFDTRVAAAKAAVATRPGFIYDTAMVPALHHALVPCVPPGNDQRRGGEFVLVADVDARGRATNIEVRPATALARCFAGHFRALALQPPPLARGQRLYPVVVEMQTRP